MSNDSTEEISPEDRLLNLMERWGREAASQTETMRSIKDLAASISSCQMEVKKKVDALTLRCAESQSSLSRMQAQCQGVWEKQEKLSGVRGFLDWMFLKAKEQPMAFALVFVTSVSMAILAAVLGWDIPSLIAKFQ
jgi:hypothetical protein